MKLILKDHSAPPFDVSSGQAQLYLDSGKYEKYVPTTPTPVPNSKWSVSRGFRNADYEESPFILWFCSTCAGRAQITGPTCHKTQQIRHCGVVENVPEHIGAKFAEMYKTWKARYQRPARTSPNTVRTV